MKPYLLWLVLIVLFIAGCSKSKTPGPTDNGSNSAPKLAIVSGNNQTAKIGLHPADTIKVKLIGTGVNVNNYSVEFRGSGCNADLPSSSGFQSNGTTVAFYRLAGNVGAQTFQATLIENASSKRIDSVTFNFTGTPLTPGLNYGACTPYVDNSTFCKTGTGRIFAAFDASKTALRYSDDEGASWYPVKVLGVNHRFQCVRSDGKNQVMLDDLDDGIYYSADNGETWRLQPNAPFKGKEYGSMTYTYSGKMFYVARFAGAYYSDDNGLNWTKLNLRSDDDYWTAQEGPGGEFYIFGEDYGIYKSIDKGKTWNLLPGVVKGDSSPDGMFAFYVDNKTGYIYKSAQQPTQLLWLSTDGGNNYKTYLSSLNTLANYITKFNDMLYFQSGHEIYKIDAPNHAVKLFGEAPISFDGNFMVSDHNYLIFPGTNFIYILK